MTVTAAGSRRSCLGQPWWLGLCFLGCVSSSSVDDEHASSTSPSALASAGGFPAEARAALLIEEERLLGLRAAAPQPAWEANSGDNPFLAQSIPGTSRWIGALRGAGRIELRDASGARLREVEAPPLISGWTEIDDSRMWAVGEGAATLFAYDVAADRLDVAGRWTIADGHGFRDIAAREGHLYVADRVASAIRRIDPQASTVPGTLSSEFIAACPGALAVRTTSRVLAALCLLDHHIRVWPFAGNLVRTDAVVELAHDGPFWSMALYEDEDRTRLVATGVENHPLDRSDGAFGYVDSFAFVWDLVERDGRWVAEAKATINLSEHGVVMPKWVRWETSERFATVAYGSPRGAEIDLSSDPPVVRTFELPPGSQGMTGALERAWVANPLLDAWVLRAEGRVGIHPVGPPRDLDLVLGESLLFTTLMAPLNRAEGRRSRFTCETCHFEGLVDGRTHYTGRGEVYATTKTLRGLVGNRPHFSRALDRTTTQMIHNEFKVANRGSDLDPWFSLRPEDAPWLSLSSSRSPVDLRRAVLRFLATFEPEEHPSTQDGSPWTPLEREGAETFAAHCESCHQARTLSEREDLRLAVADWEAAIAGGVGIVWARDERVFSGVAPYVHREGARVPSLRRLFAKAPYFTNGHARTLTDVLEAIDLGPPFLHEGKSGGRSLSAREQTALRAFLQLL